MSGGGADPMAEIKAGFFQECEELLEELADGLEALAGATPGLESFNAVFRAVHSIKGGAAAFGLGDLTDFAHGFESRLSTFRDSADLPTPQDVSALQQAADRLAALVSLAARGETISEEARLSDAAVLVSPNAEETALLRAVPLTLAGNATDARSILAGLKTLGEPSTTIALASLPKLEEYDPEDCRLVWEIELTTDLTELALMDALKAVDPLGHLIGQEKPVAETSKSAQAGAAAAASVSPPTIRVDLDRIDRLINLVGELVINQAMLARSAEDLGAQSNSDHILGLDELMRLTRDLQDSVMQIRAQPVKPLLQRMARICREAAATSGKTVELVYDGQETEIDKTVIERLADPLTHMIRNAVDHAIEPPDTRKSAGKSPTGRVTLRASHRSSRVILEVIDDGAGIDRAKVLASARKKGLVAPQTELSPAEIDQLLFLPGFSTTERVSALSGRGVGMDVVRAAIHGLGGRIAIDSEPGTGTRFEIALPLTLAVLDAMVVGVADQTLVLPLSTIHETLTVAPQDVLELVPGQRMLRYSGRAIALFDLAEELDYQARRESLADCVALIVLAEGHPPTALVIDEIYE